MSSGYYASSLESTMLAVIENLPTESVITVRLLVAFDTKA